jgi:hypothetical protein
VAPLLQLLPWAAWAAAPAASAAADAGAGPRYLTPEQQAAVDAAFDSALPKTKVGKRIHTLSGGNPSGTGGSCWPCCPQACAAPLAA